MCGKIVACVAIFVLVPDVLFVDGSVQVFNHAIDEIIEWTNGNVSASETVPDVTELALPLSVFGLKIPFLRMWLSASQGTRNNVNTLSRVGNATITNENHNVVLNTNLVYDRIDLSFKNIDADFWYMQTAGGLTVTVPTTKLDVSVTHNGKQCNLKINSFTFDTLSISVTPSNFVGRLLGPLLRLALDDNERSVLLDPLTSQIQNSLTTNFAEVYCQKASCLDFWDS